MFDVITFGSATKDIFLQVEEGTVIEGNNFLTKKGVCFSLGSKVKINDIYFTSGGAGTNTAATFAKQGFSVAYCGKVGKDGAGDNILKELEDYHIDSRFISSTKKRVTSHSVVLNVPKQDRTILAYRGASDLQTKKDISFNDLKARWFYLGPFSINMKGLFYEIIKYARCSGVKTMANPSKVQLKDRNIKKALLEIDVVLMNLEEASILTGIPYSKEKKIIRETVKLTKGITLITKGRKGVVAYDGDSFYEAKPAIPTAVDRTGAGDSFGSGFLSSFMRGEDVKKGVQLGIANSTSCLQKIGAKNGLLKKESRYKKVRVHEFN